MAEPRSQFTGEQLAAWVCDARQRTCELVSDLSDEQLLGPRLAIVNPLLWEIGHVAWFQEKWVLRHARGEPGRPGADALYDSSSVAHNARWELPLPGLAATLRYLNEIRDRVIDGLLRRQPHSSEIYFVLLSVFHEDMHTEAFTYTRQTLGYPAPRFSRPLEPTPPPAGPWPGDVEIAGGAFLLGATPDEPFVFDNEKYAHPVELRPFRIARAPVTQAEFAVFVDDNGYRRRECWSEAGWRWRLAENADHPAYWRRDGRDWLRRDFDAWVLLEPHRPVLHVNWYEAQAYCSWAGRRLPTEAEWEAAASTDGSLSPSKRRFPWGDAPPTAAHANLDWRHRGCLDVAAMAGGDSPGGCRQLIGNVWEWTSSDFSPYPGFVVDPYKEYSAPWFGTHKVLRGGCWATRGRLLRNTWRNYYLPQRRDAWTGFRTCEPTR